MNLAERRFECGEASVKIQRNEGRFFCGIDAHLEFPIEINQSVIKRAVKSRRQSHPITNVISAPGSADGQDVRCVNQA